MPSAAYGIEMRMGRRPIRESVSYAAPTWPGAPAAAARTAHGGVTIGDKALAARRAVAEREGGGERG